MADGLVRVAGNTRLFRSLLEQFAGKQAGAADEIAGALARGDRKAAERVAHTLKGVAGNLGIRRIQASAEKLERALRDGDAASPAALSEFASLLGPQVEAIRRAFGSSGSGGSGGSGIAPDTTAAKPYDAAAGRAAIGRLRKLLASSDGGAADAFDEVSGTLAGAVAGPRLEALGEAIHEFDFEGALSKLDAIAGECGAAEESA